MSRPEQASQTWCRHLIGALVAAGIKDLVVCPGSRSTPILLAALHSPLRLYSIIDERSAAFFALGRVRGEMSSVAMLCTSGSAGAHALPALLEAKYASHRLVVITSDRPPELHGCGANQSIDQRQLFAAACPPTLELGVPSTQPDSVLGMSRSVYETVVLATGPIHINAAFRKPLEPAKVPNPVMVPEGSQWPPEPRFSPVYPSTAIVNDATLKELAAQCEVERGVIVAGPASALEMGPALLDLATATGFVILAEGTSSARYTGQVHEHRCDGFAHILKDPESQRRLAPEVILQFGAEPAGSALLGWLRDTAARIIRFSGAHPKQNPSGTAQLVMGDELAGCRRLQRYVRKTGSVSYLKDWRSADVLAWNMVDSVHAKQTESELSEASALAEIVAGLPRDSQLTIGNSMPIRGLDTVVSGQCNRLRILHQRGCSGIEGLIAGAIGSSTSERPCAVILGDVSCAHDIASLALADHAAGPLSIFMLDNQGGQIFSHLPIADVPMAASEFSFWTTAPALCFADICQGYRIPYMRVEDSKGLADALHWSKRQNGACFVHVVVAQNSMLEFQRHCKDRFP